MKFIKLENIISAYNSRTDNEYYPPTAIINIEHIVSIEKTINNKLHLKLSNHISYCIKYEASFNDFIAENGL